MKQIYLILTIIFSFQIIHAQNTVGLISYDPDQAYDGYNLMFPHNQGNVFLLNNCGEIVHTWPDINYKPGNTALLDNDGNLIVCKGNGPLSNTTIHAGGGGELVEKRDWDNNLIWSFTLNDTLNRLHHDIALKPNGNILMIVWERKTAAEAIQAGRDPSFLTENELWPDYVIELDGANGTDIVWEWHAWDHLIQDFDATKDNFGVVEDNPHKIDINYSDVDGRADWMHTNAIDYNPQKAQIMLSVPAFNEIWIIDQTTSTSQAASSIGGVSGRGGDLLYRWGNPLAYKSGTAADQTLFYQHDAHWVDLGLDASHPDFGKIAVFNNQVGADFSEVNIFSAVFDEYGWEYPMAGNTWGPAVAEWTYRTDIPQEMHSTGLSSVQRLKNGNTLIGIGRPGRNIEINPAGDIVWEYVVPLNGGNPVSQGSVLALNANLLFKIKRYAPDFAGFAGRDLTMTSYLELDPDTDFCDMLIPINEVANQPSFSVFPNPVKDHLQIQIPNDGTPLPTTMEWFNTLGERVAWQEVQGFQFSIELNDLAPGIYFLSIDGFKTQKVTILP